MLVSNPLSLELASPMVLPEQEVQADGGKEFTIFGTSGVNRILRLMRLKPRDDVVP